jgi:hypothetical protein
MALAPLPERDYAAIVVAIATGRAKRLGALRNLARLLDSSLRIPGTQIRFGLDPLLGLIPVAGDLLTGLAAAWIVIEGYRLGASFMTLARMLGNVVLDVVVGSIPFLGDLADFVLRTNQRNIELLEQDPRLRELFAIDSE